VERETKSSSPTPGLQGRGAASGLFGSGADSSASQAARLTLVLLMPLLESQSRIDASLCSATAMAMAGFLGQCEPGSLHDMPPDCLDGLQSLLHSWLSCSGQGYTTLPGPQLMQIAHSLVALSFAR